MRQCACMCSLTQRSDVIKSSRKNIEHKNNGELKKKEKQNAGAVVMWFGFIQIVWKSALWRKRPQLQTVS